MRRIECFLVERTDDMTPFHDGVSSPIYRRVDNGQLMHSGWVDHPGIDRMPPGAMWISTMGLVIRTPGGDWFVDRVLSNGAKWSWSGTPPKISVVGSIKFDWRHDGDEVPPPLFMRNYHGVLTDGVLEECDDTWMEPS